MEKIISDLLYEHECVIIPGFGAFITNDRPAYIDKVKNRIYPPSKILAFNPSLKTNDGLLSHHISVHEKLSFRDALKQIRETVNHWNGRLEKGETLSLESIGELRMNEDKKLIFTPYHSRNYLADSFGFEAVELLPVNRVKVELDVDEYREPEKEMGRHEFKNLPVKRNRKILTYSLLAYAPLLMLMWFFLITQEPFVDQNYSGLNPFDSSVSKNTHEQAVVKTGDKDVKAEETKTIKEIEKSTIENEPEEIKVEKAGEIYSGPYYHVIGGSFQSSKNAQEYQDQLSGKSYKSEVLASSKGFFRVSYAKFREEPDALIFLREVKKNENQYAWILKQ